MGVLVLVIGLSLRVLASFAAVSFGDISLKERFFVALAWLPKATVQAALGPLALDNAKALDRDDKDDMIRYGDIVLTIAVLVILITAPILFPVAMALGINPIHFGVMITVNMEIGMLTPPVGLNLYVASGISRLGLTEMTIAVTPWLLTMLVFLMIVTYWPPLSLWLPRTLGMIP